MSLWLQPQPLVLASKSTARRAVLTGAGLPHEAYPADLDERAAEAASSDASPAGVALHLAIAKAEAVSAQHPDRIVLGADQTLSLGTRRFSKPANAEAAAAQLRALSGQTHELNSGIAVVQAGRLRFSLVETARLTMRPLSDAFIAAYLDAAGPAVQTSVGAYQLEGLGVHLFGEITGDHFTILGLPLLRLLDFFRAEGWLRA